MLPWFIAGSRKAASRPWDVERRRERREGNGSGRREKGRESTFKNPEYTSVDEMMMMRVMLMLVDENVNTPVALMTANEIISLSCNSAGDNRTRPNTNDAAPPR